MTSLTEAIKRLEELTEQNLDILKTLNDSFFTKKEHLVVSMSDNKFVIPSFLSLENKINALQESLYNLVNAPAAGEAYFQFDGNSKTIQVRGFNNTPNALYLKPDNAKKFLYEDTNFFKDMITPNAYVRFDLTTLPDDISKVIVKKVVPITARAKAVLGSYIHIDTEEGIDEYSVSVPYRELYKQLAVLNKGVDYEEYDTVKQLPVRQAIGTGTYVITGIIKDETLSDLTQQLTLKFAENTQLYYKKFDETIDVELEPGQYLTTYDGRVKLQIVDVNMSTNQLVLNIVNGDYLDIAPYTGTETELQNIQDLHKLRFFSDRDYSKDKYMDVTLEENQYIGVFIAALNDRMNVQSPWGDGVVVDSYRIKNAVKETESYQTFYKDNVKNIGDILAEIVAIIDTNITKYPKEDFDTFTQYKPALSANDLSVIQINKHLNDSPTVQRIRSLYSQKKQYELKLDEVQKKISEIQSTLASNTFDDTSNIRTLYESQLSENTAKKNEIVTAINNVISEISLAANQSEVPIENAKYHIRGYFDWVTLAQGDTEIAQFMKHIRAIQVQYRYKNKDRAVGNADSLQNGKFIFSDWNIMPGFNRVKNPSCDVDSQYTFDYPDYVNGAEVVTTDDKNVPSFNQIDIPITQGETVDIRLKIVWDFGAPFIETTSDWSNIVNVEFPDELLKDVQILTIIEENNSDIETNRFKNILIDEGVNDHVNDKLSDQDLVYFHHPEHISSGFYTAERRVIPLKDKLSSMDNAIVSLEDAVYGSNSDNLKIEFIFASTSTLIAKDVDNVVNVSVDKSGKTEPIDRDEAYKYSNIANIQITNTSTRTVNIYSLFPGSRTRIITDPENPRSYSNKDSYDNARIMLNNYTSASIGLKATDTDEGSSGAIGVYRFNKQHNNQFMYFRSKDVYADRELKGVITEDMKEPQYAPMITKSMSQLFVNSDSARSFKILEPGESLILPFWFSFYKISDDGYTYSNDELEVQFDIRLSLFNDPTNYYFKIVNNSTEENKSLHKKIVESQTNNITKYSSVIAKIPKDTIAKQTKFAPVVRTTVNSIRRR